MRFGEVQGPTLLQVFQVFCSFGARKERQADGRRAEMDVHRFCKLCKDCGLYGPGFSQTDAEIFFVRAAPKLPRRIVYPAFRDTLLFAVAKAKGCRVEDVVDRIRSGTAQVTPATGASDASDCSSRRSRSISPLRSGSASRRSSSRGWKQEEPAGGSPGITGATLDLLSRTMPQFDDTATCSGATTTVTSSATPLAPRRAAPPTPVSPPFQYVHTPAASRGAPPCKPAVLPRPVLSPGAARDGRPAAKQPTAPQLSSPAANLEAFEFCPSSAPATPLSSQRAAARQPQSPASAAAATPPFQFVDPPAPRSSTPSTPVFQLGTPPSGKKRAPPGREMQQAGFQVQQHQQQQPAAPAASLVRFVDPPGPRTEAPSTPLFQLGAPAKKQQQEQQQQQQQPLGLQGFRQQQPPASAAPERDSVRSSAPSTPSGGFQLNAAGKKVVGAAEAARTSSPPAKPAAWKIVPRAFEPVGAAAAAVVAASCPRKADARAFRLSSPVSPQLSNARCPRDQPAGGAWPSVSSASDGPPPRRPRSGSAAQPSPASTFASSSRVSAASDVLPSPIMSPPVVAAPAGGARVRSATFSAGCPESVSSLAESPGPAPLSPAFTLCDKAAGQRDELSNETYRQLWLQKRAERGLCTNPRPSNAGDAGEVVRRS
ncbi:hypothetical protein DIPPA_06217 [Diplonema papillatum]|nr:hypothetical protein DIPPA_06217 [Diplonema papillatum]